MNNKLMYNRCVIPEIGINNEWKSSDDKESLMIKRRQKILIENQRKEEKIKMQKKTNDAGKARRKKKACRSAMISFVKIEDNSGRRKYNKVVKTVIEEGSHT